MSDLQPPQTIKPLNIPLATALRQTFQKKYRFADFRADCIAGLIVSIVALPLSMALAIAIGAAPQHGLYTSIVAGAIIALTGGSRFQISGPSTGLIVILAPILSKFGWHGLLTVGLLAGLIFIIMGLARVGRFIAFIPDPVTTGFAAGMATVIACLQIKDAFGLRITHTPDEFLEKIYVLWQARTTVSWPDVSIAVITLLLLVLIPKLTRKIPTPLIAIGLASIINLIASRIWPWFHTATLGSRFSTTFHGQIYFGIPPIPPQFAFPWEHHSKFFDLFSHIHKLIPAAFAVAMLGAIESLLSAVIADGMTGKKHNSNAELIGLGIGNVFASFFGGIPATGALARTATNIRAGASSPIAAVIHALAILLAVLVFAKWVAYIPMAALAALLILVAYHVSEIRHFIHTIKVAPRGDVFVLITCYTLTVIFDMIIAVTTGVILAALLFMRRMSELTNTRIVDANELETTHLVPQEVTVYEIDGPLFFGAAQKGFSALESIKANTRIVVLGLGHVPMIDATALVALESTLRNLKAANVLVVLTGPLPEPQQMFEKANLEKHHDHLFLADTLQQGIQLASDLCLLSTPSFLSTGTELK